MSSRLLEKEERKAARIEAEQRAKATERRTRRLRTLALVGVVALIVVVAAIVASTGASEDAQPTRSAAETTRLYQGIPQDGITLGRQSAPVTLTEFADLQCPFCKEFSDRQMPEIVRDYVRTGQVKIVFRNLDFLGEDSVIAARFAGAAALQDRLFQFVEAFYAKQGAENSGYVTNDFLREVAADAGVDADAAFKAMEDERVLTMVANAEREMQANGVQGTPSFLVDGGPVIAPDAVKAELDKALR
jgi:protein-disulfide isomerase